jgi:hypothetical protein
MPDPDRLNDNKALTPLLLMAMLVVVGIFVGFYFGHAPAG